MTTSGSSVVGFGCNDDGQIGRPVTKDENEIKDASYPIYYIPIFQNLKVTAVSCGSRHTLALTSDGSVRVYTSAFY